jgi:hypothetical protein
MTNVDCEVCRLAEESVASNSSDVQLAAAVPTKKCKVGKWGKTRNQLTTIYLFIPFRQETPLPMEFVRNRILQVSPFSSWLSCSAEQSLYSSSC